MRIVFCIDDNPRYLMMLRVAVRSLRALYGDTHPVLCVYAGNDAAILLGLAEENIPVARYSPILTREKIPQEFHFAIGCFLKLEFALVPELADDDFVLYCDSDVLFDKPFDALLEERPAYMAMAREDTAPFFHQYEKLEYEYRERHYVVPMPFPIWTFSSGVVMFNLARLRKHGYVHNFLAFCEQNIQYIGNLDQSLFNYFFGKRIQQLPACYNCPPYRPMAKGEGKIIHFHGPKPWIQKAERWAELRIHHYTYFMEQWFSLLSAKEQRMVKDWIY